MKTEVIFITEVDAPLKTKLSVRFTVWLINFKRGVRLFVNRKKIYRLNNERMDLMDRLNEVRRVHGRSAPLQSRLNYVTAELMRIGL